MDEPVVDDRVEVGEVLDVVDVAVDVVVSPPGGDLQDGGVLLTGGGGPRHRRERSAARRAGAGRRSPRCGAPTRAPPASSPAGRGGPACHPDHTYGAYCGTSAGPRRGVDLRRGSDWLRGCRQHAPPSWPRRAPQRAPGAPGAEGLYRWLVRTTGSPPSIRAENALPGTTAWRLPGPADQVGGLAYGNVRGYATPETVAAGATVRIAAVAPGARRLRISVFRMGWYGGTGGRAVLVSRALPVLRQPPCAHSTATGLTTCHWRPSLSIPHPTGAAERHLHRQADRDDGRERRAVRGRRGAPGAAGGDAPDGHLRGLQRLGRRFAVSGRQPTASRSRGRPRASPSPSPARTTASPAPASSSPVTSR